ncbi:DUF3825 domain-containing protein [Actinomadura sp. HBU206391]|uniref:DUF3825 domain-containing protein n=1 Tax=Actinomadura sp. HBU206391 TaxID=2731692 RepID=UPI00164F7371|nr:DUF3825 domain-containing protein [Actinomadura sp. HBU206391]MBC6458011.1 DUF3825 domain-containing protein [Actinomadura sp. HBU206391]
MTLHESKHAGYTDRGRLHQHFAGDTSAPAAQPDTEPAAPLPPLADAQPPMPAGSSSMPAGQSPMPGPSPLPGGPSTRPVGHSPIPSGPSPLSGGTVMPGGPPAAQRRSQRLLHKHADLGLGTGDDDCFTRLARLAEREHWAGRSAGRPDETWVLREYIEWTFERLQQQRLVVTSPDGGHSVFNTGLATAQQETIYGLFTPNNDPDGPPWQLGGWLPEGDGRLLDRFPELPGLATYTDDPGDFVYDWRRELTVVPKQLLESKDSLAVLPGPLRSNPYQASLVLEGAVRRAESRVRRSYRAAVPCWDPAHERVQLLLPLSLTTPESVDAALVVSREGEGYRGTMVLGLDVAYARARQIARPEEWLTAR